jgi:hypothetical protein
MNLTPLCRIAGQDHGQTRRSRRSPHCCKMHIIHTHGPVSKSFSNSSPMQKLLFHEPLQKKHRAQRFKRWLSFNYRTFLTIATLLVWSLHTKGPVKQLLGRIIEVEGMPNISSRVERTSNLESILGMVLQESMEWLGSAECWTHQRHCATSCARRRSPWLSVPFLKLAEPCTLPCSLPSPTTVVAAV